MGFSRARPHSPDDQSAVDSKRINSIVNPASPSRSTSLPSVSSSVPHESSSSLLQSTLAASGLRSYSTRAPQASIETSTPALSLAQLSVSSSSEIISNWFEKGIVPQHSQITQEHVDEVNRRITELRASNGSLKKDLDAALSQVQQEDFKKVKAEIEDLQKDISELKGGVKDGEKDSMQKQPNLEDYGEEFINAARTLEAHLKLAKVKSVQELADSICGKYDKVVGKLHRRDASIVEYKAKLKRMEKEKERLQETLDEMGWTPIKALKEREEKEKLRKERMEAKHAQERIKEQQQSIEHLNFILNFMTSFKGSG